MTDGTTVGRAGYMVCPHCPWPIHIRIPVDPGDLDRSMAGVRLAASVHHRQHETDAEPI